MAEKPQGPPVRIVGSRELHQKLPAIMRELESLDSRFVLTVHGRPRAVLVGASTYLALVQGKQHPSEALVGLQLSALLGTGLDSYSLDLLQGKMVTGPDSTPTPA